MNFFNPSTLAMAAGTRNRAISQNTANGASGFGNALADILGQAATKHAQGADTRAKKAFADLVAAMHQRQALEPPTMEQGIGKGDLLPMLGLGILAKILGAKDRDIAEGASGFLGGRQQWAQGRNEDALRRYQIQGQEAEQMRQNAIDTARLQYQEAAGERDYIRGQMDDERKFARQSTLARENAERTLEGKRDIEREKALYMALRSTNPAIRMEAARQLYAGDADAVSAYGKLSPSEKNMLANAEYTAGPKTESTQAKTLTENALRPHRIGKAKADVARVLGGIKLDDARRRQIEQKIATYDDEFQLRAANVYSQMAARDQKGQGASDYWGKGYEASFKQMANIAKQQIALIAARNSGTVAIGGKLPPSEQAAYDQAQADLRMAEDSLKRIADGKVQRAKNYGRGGGGGPTKQIDVSGGFSPVIPEVPQGVPKVPPTAGIGAAGGARAGSTPKRKAQPPKGKKPVAQKGKDWSYIPD